MTMEVLFAAMSVAAFADAVEWYERFFGRAPDIVVHDHEVMWHVTSTGWLYVIEDAARAGQSVVTISVSDLTAAVAELQTRGIIPGSIEAVGDDAHKSTVTDPAGNMVALIEVTTPGS